MPITIIVGVDCRDARRPVCEREVVQCKGRQCRGI